jgi:hypothetical protein
LPGGGIADAVDEAERARVEDVLDAERAQVFALFRVTGSGVDLGAEEPGDLDGRQAHAAGRRVDQDPLPARDVRVLREDDGSRRR